MTTKVNYSAASYGASDDYFMRPKGRSINSCPALRGIKIDHQEMAKEEQYDLDVMWDYLEKRDGLEKTCPSKTQNNSSAQPETE